MTKEEFFQQACLSAISRIEPAYWDDIGIKSIIEFANTLTNKVFSKEEPIDEEELDELAKEEQLHLVSYSELNLLSQRNKDHADLHNVYDLMNKMYKAGFRKAKQE